VIHPCAVHGPALWRGTRRAHKCLIGRAWSACRVRVGPVGVASDVGLCVSINDPSIGSSEEGRALFLW
jgi:hypothetical protein